jgi:hypothetical protein
MESKSATSKRLNFGPKLRNYTNLNTSLNVLRSISLHCIIILKELATECTADDDIEDILHHPEATSSCPMPLWFAYQ